MASRLMCLSNLSNYRHVCISSLISGILRLPFRMYQRDPLTEDLDILDWNRFIHLTLDLQTVLQNYNP